MSELEKNMIDYFVICIREFAERYDMLTKDAMLYLDNYGGLLNDHLHQKRIP